MFRLVVALLLALALPTTCRAQEPDLPAAPPVLDWKAPDTWRALGRRWATASGPLAEAALARVAWEAAVDPWARRACGEAAKQVATGRAGQGQELLAALAEVRGTPRFDPPADEAALTALVAQRTTAPLEVASRTLRLLARIDRPDGAELLARLRAAQAPALDRTLEALEDALVVRRRLDALTEAAQALEAPDPRTAVRLEWRVQASLQSGRGTPQLTLARGWLLSTDGTGGWAVDSLGQLARLSRWAQRVRLDPTRDGVELLHQGGLDQAWLQELDIRLYCLAAARARGQPAFDQGRAAALVRAQAAHVHDRRGQAWLAFGLAAQGEADWDAALDALVRGRLAEATRRLHAGEPRAALRAFVAPALERGSPLVRAEAKAIHDGLAEGPPVRGVTWAGWQTLGLEERLELLEAALAGYDLAAPFPADAPLLPEGPPTVCTHLEALGWSALPLLVRHVEDPRLVPTNGGVTTVGASALYLLWTRAGLDVDDWFRAAEATAWWEKVRAAGPAPWWRAHAGEAARWRGSGEERLPLEALARDLGPAAAPLFAAEVGRGEPWLRAAVGLRLPGLRARFVEAAESGDVQRIAVGLVGLHGLDEPGALPRLEELVRVALAAGRPEACGVVEVLRRVDPPAAEALARRISGLRPAGQREREAMLRAVDVVGVDGRLAACRLVAQAFAFQVPPWQPEPIDTDQVPFRELAARGGLPPTAPPLDVVREVLARDAPAWRDDPARREHAVGTALLLGAAQADELGRRVGVDVRDEVVAMLLGPRRLETLGPLPWLAGWIDRPGRDGPRRVTARALASREPIGPVARIAAVEVDASVPLPIAERARRLEGRDVGAAELADLVWAWRRELRTTPSIRMRLEHGPWREPTLRLEPGSGPSGLRIDRGGRRVESALETDTRSLEEGAGLLLQETLGRPAEWVDARLTLGRSP